MKYLGREVTYTHQNKRLHVYFENSTIYAGTSFALKRMNRKQLKNLAILLVAPYKYINNRFLKN